MNHLTWNGCGSACSSVEWIWNSDFHEEIIAVVLFMVEVVPVNREVLSVSLGSNLNSTCV